MTSVNINQKNSMRNWRKQLWVLLFTVGLSCLGQTVQPPLGATPKQGGTTFRLWAPFVDSVTIKVNEREPVRMSKGDDTPTSTSSYSLPHGPRNAVSAAPIRSRRRHRGTLASRHEPESIGICRFHRPVWSRHVEWISPGQLDESGLRDRTNDL